MTNIGNKHICEQCNSKFYDLCEDKIVCPQCGLVKNDTKQKKIEGLVVDNVDLFDSDYLNNDNDTDGKELEEDLDKYDEDEELSDLPDSNSIRTE